MLRIVDAVSRTLGKPGADQGSKYKKDEDLPSMASLPSVIRHQTQIKQVT